MLMTLFKFLFVSGLLFSFSFAVAETDIQFTNMELGAAYTLVRPELNTIELNGRTGTFTPAPALRFFGLGVQKFDVNFSEVINLVDLQFNHLKAKTPTIQFNNGSLELNVALNDQDQVLQSRLGSLSINGVALVAVLGWEAQADGTQKLSILKTRFNGDMTGTGLLKPPFILGKVRSYLLKLLTQQVQTVLDRPFVQESIQNGLISWAKFYTGEQYHSITPNSIRFFDDALVAGISYKVQ